MQYITMMEKMLLLSGVIKSISLKRMRIFRHIAFSCINIIFCMSLKSAKINLYPVKILIEKFNF